ncbi:FecR domain-containing protein [Novosphingobium sp. 9U]|uniref:FecR family protein n=1 Tax=Novosphingobium sp. 9U TaxID=2653158 RepID=UPI0012F251CA|nr:FecR domain-containing protein [Novosphingobium sp. 9U]VWX49764.1 Antisigma transmembrane sensor FpvR [Novosphingobium sp. 9U]
MDDEDQANKDHQAEATEWFARLKTTPLAKTTLEGFFEWQRDPAHAEAFAQVERLWGRAGDLRSRTTMQRFTQEALARPQSMHSRRPSLRMATLVCSLSLAVAVGGALLVLRSRSADYMTGIGEQRAVALTDGSHVRLATDTRLDVKMKDAARHVDLEGGEALFEVAHDTMRPFVVDTGDIQVVATGTRFDVRHVGSRITVTLLSGGVDIRKGETLVAQLRPGQSWQSDRPAAQAVTEANAGAVLAWTQGRLVFDKIALKEAVNEVNRYSERKIVLVAPKDEGELISGSFKAGDTAAFADAAAAMLDLTAQRQADGSITLVP